jgi:hypothetical protein
MHTALKCRLFCNRINDPSTCTCVYVVPIPRAMVLATGRYVRLQQTYLTAVATVYSRVGGATHIM